MEHLRNTASSWLQKIERILRLDVNYAAKGSFWTTIRFAIGFGGSLVTMAAYGNLLPREIYGTYSYLVALGSSLAFLTLSGIGPAVTRAVARGLENVVPAALHLQLRFNMLAVATVAVAAIYYFLKDNLVFGISLVLLAVAYPIANTFHIYEQILTGKKKFDSLTKINGVITIISAAATVITLFLTDNVLIIISVFAFMSLVPNYIAYRLTTKNLDKSTPYPETISEMRRTTFHITGASFIGTIATYIDKVLLFQIAGPASLAVYGFAIAGPDSMKGLIKNWISIALPKLADRSLDNIRSVFYKRIALFLVMGVLLTIIYIVFAPILFKLVLPKYLDAIIYSQAYALGLILVPVIVYIGSVFSSQNMLKSIYASSLGSHIIRITLYVVFAWLWQIWGLILASLAFHIINTIYSIVIWEVESRRLIKINAQ